MLAYRIVLALVLVVATLVEVQAQSQPQITDTSFVNFTFIDPRSGQQSVNTSDLSLDIGDNITLQCVYSNPDWSVSIVRFHPDDPQKYLTIVTDKKFDKEFAALKSQFHELDSRLAISYRGEPLTVGFTIKNFQYEDAGTFGCYASDNNYKYRTQVANLTISVQDKIIFTDLIGNEQNFMNIQPSQTYQLVVNCSLYHVLGLENAENYAWFKTCDLFDSKGGKLQQPKCSGPNITGVFVEKSNYSDSIRYGQYWPRRYERSIIQTTFPITVNSYNKSFGCFGLRNDLAMKSDFMTIVQEGVDLYLDPANFQCSVHRVSATQGKSVKFSCTVRGPTYRTGLIYWEVLAPPTKTNAPWTLKCDSLNKCNIKNVNFYGITNITENLYITASKAEMEVRAADSENTKYRYRLVAQYPLMSFRSSNFSIDYTGPQTGKVTGGSGCMLIPAPFFLAVLAAAINFLSGRF